MKVWLIPGGIGLFHDPKLYWVRWNRWKMYHGVDYRCRCKDVIAFPPCTDCGAGT